MPLLKAKPGLLRPVEEKFVWQTLFFAWFLPFFLPRHYLPLPDLTLLVYVFWVIREHPIVGIWSGFIVGFAIDVASGGLWGMHAFIYAVVGYLALLMAKRIASSPVWQQTIAVLPLFYLHAILLSVFSTRYFLSHLSLFWLSPFITACCWPVAFIILLFPQRRSRVGEHTPI